MLDKESIVISISCPICSKFIRTTAKELLEANFNNQLCKHLSEWLEELREE